jgi:hypothetical protein
MTRRHFCAAGLASAAGLLLPGLAADVATPRLSRRWTVIIQHSHIDIGYTEKQEITADQHAQLISQAVRLALSPKQKSRDKVSRFKFTCEGFWQVEQFLAKASTQTPRWFRLGAATRSMTS